MPADYLALLRPAQWIKNGFVLAPLVFSHRLFQAAPVASAGLAFIAFCSASSAAYVLNDLIDRVRDREHPLKCLRPIAAGRLVESLFRGGEVAASLGRLGHRQVEPRAVGIRHGRLLGEEILPGLVARGHVLEARLGEAAPCEARLRRCQDAGAGTDGLGVGGGGRHGSPSRMDLTD